MYLRHRHRGQHAVQLPRAHPVGDQRAPRPYPVIAVFRQVEVAQPLGGNQGSPHQDVGELDVLFAYQLATHQRMDAVGADQGVATQDFP
ncbi:hypothetical protein D9M68_945610 [compost metagenome]